MYDYIPVRKGILARLLALFLFLLTVGLLILSTQLDKAAPFVQSAALLLLLPTVQIVTRFIIIRYLYRIAPYESGEVDFEIYSYRGGNKMQLICRVGLEEVTAVTPLGDENRKPQKGVPRYNYCPDMKPQNAFVLSVTNADGRCEVLLQPDDKLLEIFRSAVAGRVSEE